MIREFAILLAVFVCIFFFVPSLTHPPSINLNGVPALIAFISLMLYSGFHIKKLYARSPNGAIVFSVILLATILISSIYFWWWSRPLLV